MAYSTPADVRRAASPDAADNPTVPTEGTGTAADYDDAMLSDAIAEADATIDGYLSGRYSVPVAAVNNVVPHPIDWWSRNIALYNATLTLRGQLDFSDQDPVARRYNATLAALTDVRASKRSIPTLDDLTLADTAGTGNEAEGAGAPINPYADALFPSGCGPGQSAGRVTFIDRGPGHWWPEPDGYGVNFGGGL